MPGTQKKVAKNKLYNPGDSKRRTAADEPVFQEGYRSDFRRDYARLVHSPSFRRLQGKTQLFPGHESDFYRNRLTHSLEVAQIAKAIASKLNSESKFFRAPGSKIDLDLVEFAGLAHDLGHPPFGHTGEAALDKCMQQFGGFEGNAQTLRILTKLEKRETLHLVDGEIRSFDKDQDLRTGLNVSFRALASILKYDKSIPVRPNPTAGHKVIKGYYETEKDIVAKIKANILQDGYVGAFKTIECSIMDLADDIAYTTYDLEDVFKARFQTPLDLLTLDSSIYELVLEKTNERLLERYSASEIKRAGGIVTRDDISVGLQFLIGEIFGLDAGLKPPEESDLDEDWLSYSLKDASTIQVWSRKVATSGYERTRASSALVKYLLKAVEVLPHQEYSQLHQVRLSAVWFQFMEIIKNLVYYTVIESPRMKILDFRGRDIVKRLFDALTSDGGHDLLPEDVRAIYESCGEVERYRVVCDYIAGMTDRYAVEYYARLFGIDPLTMHKPI